MFKLLIALTLFGSASFAADWPGTCSFQLRTVYSAGTTDGVALAANGLRRCLTITNPTGGSTLWVNIASVAGSGNADGIAIAASTTMQFMPVPGNSVWLHSSPASGLPAVINWGL